MSSATIVKPPLPAQRGAARLEHSFIPTFSEARLREAIQRVRTRELPEDLLYWARQYATVGHRDMFLWKWVLEGISLTALPSVDPQLGDAVNITKVIGVILDVLLDDVADRCGDRRYLHRLLVIPFADGPVDFAEFPAEQRAYADVTQRVWNAIQSRTHQYPRFAEFQEQWRFDYQQLLNAMHYSHLINHDVRLLNVTEHDLYSPHNMHMMVSGTLDLMCSPGFDGAELGALREALWHAQCMGRIGNLVTTWERELGDRDFSSGVFARALQTGALTVHELRSAAPETLRSAVHASDGENFYLQRWHQHRDQILARAASVRSVDLRALVGGLEKLIEIHLGSRGLK
ncbi:MAG TPA: hypothetical protein VGM03_09405 [Phycisphaerae bacterium]|jgi:hypothetical protein